MRTGLATLALAVEGEGVVLQHEATLGGDLVLTVFNF
jgi:hypothetical protein